MTSADLGPLENRLQVIEWHMLDMRKFYPLSISCTVVVRGFMYPITVAKTRLQMQRQHAFYRGTFDALSKIFRHEGWRGLYKGYFITMVQLPAGVAYVTVYERVRQFSGDRLGMTDHSLRSLLAGGCASVAGQTIVVPCDIVSQHMMMVGNAAVARAASSATAATAASAAAADPLDILAQLRSRPVARHAFVPNFDLTLTIVRQLWRRDGLRGFYRGYPASICCYVPNSAVFWFSYHKYAEALNRVASRRRLPLLAVQCAAAPVAGATTAIATNVLDLFRARLQVQRATYAQTIRTLWLEERFGVFTKGLSARITSQIIFSTFIILGYETLKRYSVHDSFQDRIVW